MAVPKKRTSKARKNLRKTIWKKKVVKQALRASFVMNSILNSLLKKKGVEVENTTLGFGGFSSPQEKLAFTELNQEKSA